ncbi:PaaD-like zinc ribbon domain-containing protein [Chitinophaga costaii]
MLHTTCPHCVSRDTYLRSPFGATLCRVTHFCKRSGQLFEQFKPLE